ncbi:MAG TPA: cytochrome c3 family protein [Tepidisphaeraceae bacterium]|nr:cytochrome c3 family protein [Tepidisphaeraceae bacterium]
MADTTSTNPARSSSPAPSSSAARFVFPRWANYLLPVVVIGTIGGGVYLPVLFGFGASPKTMSQGYRPIQPVPYSHALHVGKLGLDCRYCHNTVEKTAFAALPATQTCMNCHTNIKAKSEALQPIRDSWATGKPMRWTKVHDLPDFVYFNHSAHVNHGVGCIECHGRIDRMQVVEQAKPLSMGWCLECHRDPGPHLRPRDVAVTNMDWTRDEKNPRQSPAALVREYGIRDVTYMQSCYTCHR